MLLRLSYVSVSSIKNKRTRRRGEREGRGGRGGQEDRRAGGQEGRRAGGEERRGRAVILRLCSAPGGRSATCLVPDIIATKLELIS